MFPECCWRVWQRDMGVGLYDHTVGECGRWKMQTGCLRVYFAVSFLFLYMVKF